MRFFVTTSLLLLIIIVLGLGVLIGRLDPFQLPNLHSPGWVDSNQADLRNAFQAAFPQGSIETFGSVKLTFKPSKLVSVSGDTYALVAEGRSDSAEVCHACSGKLR